MQRRVFTRWAGMVLTAWHVGTPAQRAERVFRVGVLRPGGPPHAEGDIQAVGLPNALVELGYVEGRNLRLETRYARGDPARLAALARGFADQRFDVVVAVGFLAARAMKKAAPDLPVVMYGNFDPLALGLVNSLAQPGGNMTGVLIAPDGTLAAKRLELLKEAVPQATRIGLLAPADESFALQLQETHRAARDLGVTLPVVTVRDADYTGAFAALARERAVALVVGAHQYFVRDRRRIVELATAHRLATIWEWREQVADGGLMSYSTSLYGLLQRVASYVDRILKGAAAGNLPVERPTKFDLVINLRTARTLGLALPLSLRLRADEVIE
jgi:putative ABC transport system substrate-binding protein